MATKLPVNVGSEIGRKLWDRHQNDEYTRVSNYKEGMCFRCFSNKSVAATVIDVCSSCLQKKGQETILARIKQNFYGLCMLCKTYKYNVWQINIRICYNCHREIRNFLKEFNSKDGMFGVDPFWLRQKKKHGKDWAILFQDTFNQWKGRG